MRIFLIAGIQLIAQVSGAQAEYTISPGGILPKPEKTVQAPDGSYYMMNHYFHAVGGADVASVHMYHFDPEGKLLEKGGNENLSALKNHHIETLCISNGQPAILSSSYDKSSATRAAYLTPVDINGTTGESARLMEMNINETVSILPFNFLKSCSPDSSKMVFAWYSVSAPFTANVIVTDRNTNVMWTTSLNLAAGLEHTVPAVVVTNNAEVGFLDIQGKNVDGGMFSNGRSSGILFHFLSNGKAPAVVPIDVPEGSNIGLNGIILAPTIKGEFQMLVFTDVNHKYNGVFDSYAYRVYSPGAQQLTTIYNEPPDDQSMFVARTPAWTAFSNRDEELVFSFVTPEEADYRNAGIYHIARDGKRKFVGAVASHSIDVSRNGRMQYGVYDGNLYFVYNDNIKKDRALNIKKSQLVYTVYRGDEKPQHL